MRLETNPQSGRLSMSYSSMCALAQPHSEVAAMRIKQPVPAKALALARKPPVSLSRQARRRLKWMDHYRANGSNASKTCRHFDISRSTFYLWKNRYNPKDLASLEDKSSRPHKMRQRTWTGVLVQAVKRLREQYPRWGKAKLRVLIEREGITASVSMVGRILSHLRRTGQLVEPLALRVRGAKKQRARAYARRKPKDYVAEKPGDIVQIDTKDVYPVPGVHLKHFTATDVICKWGVLEAHSRATARMAEEVLQELLKRAPFEVRAIQVDGGSEYKKEFEAACQQMNIQLFVLPPRSPKLNGCVERSHRTHQEEFYEVAPLEDFTLAGIRPYLLAWEEEYNTVRPHQTLGYKTPLEYLQEHNQFQPRKEGVYGRY